MKAANKEIGKQIDQAQPNAINVLGAPLRIAPQLRAQGHVEARRQKVVPIRGHAAKDRLAVRRDAAARRQWLAAGGAGAAEVLDLLIIRREETIDAGEATSRDEAKARSGGGEARFGGGDTASRNVVARMTLALHDQGCDQGCDRLRRWRLRCRCRLRGHLRWTSRLRAEDPHLVPCVPSSPRVSVGLHLKRLYGDHRADLPVLAAVAALDAFVEFEA